MIDRFDWEPRKTRKARTATPPSVSSRKDAKRPVRDLLAAGGDVDPGRVRFAALRDDTQRERRPSVLSVFSVVQKSCLALRWVSKKPSGGSAGGLFRGRERDLG